MRLCSTRSWLRAPGTSIGSNCKLPSRSTTDRTDAGSGGSARGGWSRWRRTRKRRAWSALMCIGCVIDQPMVVDWHSDSSSANLYTGARMAIKRDYYEILGVGREASDDEIKRAFRRLAQQHHPDVDSSDGAEERFKELNEAYRVLGDRQRRQAYDMFGHADRKSVV